MSESLPAPSGVAVLREHIRGVQAELFLVGYREMEDGRDVPLFPPPDSFFYLWDLWRSLLPQYAPPPEYVPPQLGEETGATRREMFRALDGLMRRLEELFGPAPEPRDHLSALPVEPAQPPAPPPWDIPEVRRGAGDGPVPADPASPDGPADLITAVANQLAEDDRRQREFEQAFEAAVAGPARQLRPEWDSAWGTLWQSLAGVCSAWEQRNAAGQARPTPHPVAIDPAEVASALKRVGVTLARLEQIARSRVELNPSLHDISLRELRLPLLPLGRLDYVANDKVLPGTPPKLAAALLSLSVSADEAVLAGRVRTLLADERLRPAFGWLLFIRDCLWANPPGAEPADPVGPGPECREWSVRITGDDYRRAAWLLRGEVPFGCDELFPEGANRGSRRQPECVEDLMPVDDNTPVRTMPGGEPESSPAGGGATSPASPRYTLGQLIAVLDGIEQNRGFRLLNHQEQLRRNPISAMMNRTYEAALAWRPNEAQMPGISRIELLCDRLPGEAGITAAKVRRLRADICERLQLQIPQADQLSLNEAADALEGVHPLSLSDLQSAQKQAVHHGFAALDYINVGVEPGQVVQVTGLSCKVVRGSTPTACPDANPVLPPSMLGLAEKAIRRLTPLPEGTTIHWVGHDTGYRSRCRCAEYRNAPFAAPFDQERWAALVQGPEQRPVGNAATGEPGTGSVRVRDHLGEVRSVALADCEYGGLAACPDYLTQNPERLSSPWLFERFIAGRNLELWVTRDGIWFVADRSEGEAVVVNNDQLSDLRQCPVTTTTPGATSQSADRPQDGDSVRRTGRPPDPRKREIVSYVRELREKRPPWSAIPDAVFERFKIRYTSETLRGYVKDG